jgi:hypothetical protein
MTQRDGCWVKQTEKWPKVVTEELGPCARAETRWADDRMTRLVQECVAQADHRWQTRALEAWSRGQPLPDCEPVPVKETAEKAPAAEDEVAQRPQGKTALEDRTGDE